MIKIFIDFFYATHKMTLSLPIMLHAVNKLINIMYIFHAKLKYIIHAMY
jgi:hypothetical protein